MNKFGLNIECADGTKLALGFDSEEKLTEGIGYLAELLKQVGWNGAQVALIGAFAEQGRTLPQLR